MFKRTRLGSVSFIALIGMAGCSIPTMTLEQLKETMPPRADELDLLDMFVGQWDGGAEINFTFIDETIKSYGTNKSAWECDRRVLINRGTFDMGELGTMTGIEIWTWDDRAGKFRLHFFDSFGMTGKGTATYDEETKTWHMKGKGRSSDGHKTVSEGRVTFTDPDTLEWTWTEWTSLKLIKIAEMSGTSRRKR